MSMSPSKQTLLVGALLLGIFAGPVAFASYFLTASPSMARLHLAATHEAEQVSDQSTGSQGATGPLLAGVLYASGKATVNWNGVDLQIEDGSYAYLGGETITTEPGSMAILKLAGGDLIYLCPQSILTVQRTPEGRYSMELAQGTTRFVIASGTPFEIHANETVLRPSVDSDPSKAFIGEIKAHKDSGCLVCNLQNTVEVEAVDRGTAVGAGQFVDVAPDVTELGVELGSSGGSTAGSGEIAEPAALGALNASEIPADVFSTIQAGFAAAAGAGGSTEYLCRCEDLKRYAEGGATQVAEGEAVPTEQPPAPPPEVAPPVSPPDAPALALAVPGAPTFDPNVLPPPAAGPVPVSTLSVSPPVVPGGGFIVSPSG